jgi:hypothetical protein
MDSVVQSQNTGFQIKFNNLVYADDKLTADEKFYLLGELQKRWQKVAGKAEKKKEES